MQTRQLGRTDLHLSVMGLGTWAIGGGGWKMGWGPQDDEDSIRTIQRALDLGINWIDTAPAYGQGHSEEMVGRAIRGRRADVIVATKCGLVWEHGQYDVTGRLRAESVRGEIDDSLRRLRVERIDLYQIHWPEPDEEIEEAWTVIAEAIRDGKIRHGGVSNFDLPQMRRLQPTHPIASLQPPYSLIDREPEAELLPFCAREGIGVVAYSPLAVGVFTEKFDRAWATSRPENDWRGRYRRFRDPELSANLELVEGIKAIARREGCTVSQLAIAWVLRRPEVTSAIVGARRPDQIEETVGAAGRALSAGVIAEIEELLQARTARPASDRG